MANCSSEWMSSNTSNSSCTSSSLPSPTLAFWVSFLLLSVAVCGLNVFVVAVLIRVKAMACPLRVILVNLLLANTLSTVMSTAYSLSVIILILTQPEEPSITMCHVTLWFWLAGGSSRLSSVAEFSIVTFLIVKFGVTFLRIGLLVTAEVILWFLAFVLTVYITIPSVANCYYKENLYCVVDPPYNTNQRKFFTFTWIALAGVVPLIVTTVAPVVTWCYVKKRITGESWDYAKRMVKFVFFLLLGNSVNFFGQVTPALLRPEGRVGVYIGYSSASISNIPLPILMLIFFKPLRNEIKSWWTRHKRHNMVSRLGNIKKIDPNDEFDLAYRSL